MTSYALTVADYPEDLRAGPLPRCGDRAASEDSCDDARRGKRGKRGKKGCRGKQGCEGPAPCPAELVFVFADVIWAGFFAGAGAATYVGRLGYVRQGELAQLLVFPFGTPDSVVGNPVDFFTTALPAGFPVPNNEVPLGQHGTIPVDVAQQDEGPLLTKEIGKVIILGGAAPAVIVSGTTAHGPILQPSGQSVIVPYRALLTVCP